MNKRRGEKEVDKEKVTVYYVNLGDVKGGGGELCVMFADTGCYVDLVPGLHVGLSANNLTPVKRCASKLVTKLVL